MQIEFKDIEYTHTVAQFGGISKAAEHLYITQPALSNHIKNLEKRLEINLFERIGKKFVLTWEGEQFLKDGQEILVRRRQLEEWLDELRLREHGRLRIGMPILRGISLLPNIVPEFSRRYPLVELEFIEEDAAYLDQLVDTAQIDIAFFNQPLEANERIDYQIVSREEIVLCTSKSDPLVSSASTRSGFRYPWVDISQCENRLFLLNYPGQRCTDIAQHLFKAAGINPAKTMRTRSLMTAINLASSGIGVAFANEKYATKFYLGTAPAVFSVGEKPTFMNLVAATRKTSHLSPFARELIRIARDFY